MYSLSLSFSFSCSFETLVVDDIIFFSLFNDSPVANALTAGRRANLRGLSLLHLHCIHNCWIW